MLAGCLAGEAPLPPHEALTQAAERIRAILRDEAAFAGQRAAPPPPERPEDATAVHFWFPTHPLMTVLLAEPERVAAFNAKRSGVHLKPQYIGDWNVAVQKLTVSIAAGDVPDMALVDRAWLARLAEAGLLAELDALLPEWLADDFRPETRRAFSVDGHLYAVPADGFCTVLFYNQDLLGGAPPATWDELRQAAQSVRANPKEDAPYPLGDVPFLESLWSAGGYVCDAHTCGLDGPEAFAALDFVLGLRDAGLTAPYALGNPGAAFGRFLAGGVVMTVASSEHLARARKAAFKVGVAPVPGQHGPVSRSGESAIVVFRRYAEAKRVALTEVVAFLTGPAIQGADAAAQGSVPVRTSVAERVAVEPGLAEAYGKARATPLTGPWAAVAFETARHLDLACRWTPPAAPDVPPAPAEPGASSTPPR